MRVYILFFIVLCLSTGARAQFFNQNGGMRKAQIRQLALLKTYAGYVGKGYDILKDGVSTFRKIKNGEFDLHRDFFGALEKLNPRIRNYSRVKDIITMQQELLAECRDGPDRLRKSGQFSTAEIGFLLRLHDGLLAAVQQSVADLDLALKENALKLSDDERLQRIVAIYKTVCGHYAFAIGFSKEAQLLAVQRQQDQGENKTLMELFNAK